MEAISVLEIFKIGVGPSSSHTMGPWRAAQGFVRSLNGETPTRICVSLYGSLAKTGMGHGTDLAIVMGLCGEDPVTVDPSLMQLQTARIFREKTLPLPSGSIIRFDRDSDLLFLRDQSLPFHANGMTFVAEFPGGRQVSRTAYSVGGGFVVVECEDSGKSTIIPPIQMESAADLLAYCGKHGVSIAEVARRNEMAWRPADQTRDGLRRIWQAMRDCAFRGAHQEGTLPGGLSVTRRAAGMNRKLLGTDQHPTAETWMAAIRNRKSGFQDVINWVTCFALAVNEENAAFGRVVTAPTNGAAGVIPAVLLYALLFTDMTDGQIEDFLLTAGQIGILFKQGATISAAMGGCQAEIGVSSSMAAAALCAILGGSPAQAMMAAEIAMEHHLGMTCDPINGLVQIPCIERNAMGAIKAITASNIALAGDPSQAKVSLQAVIKTMWQTAQDMSTKYKETSEGGLATTVNISEC
jgi:L-serine dehydratase